MSTRRQFLGWGLRAAAGTVALGVAGLIGYEWPCGGQARLVDHHDQHLLAVFSPVATG